MDGGIREPEEEESLFVEQENEEIYNGEEPLSNQQSSESNAPPPDTSLLPVTLSLQLSFQQKIVGDLLSEDALVVLGRGLGISTLTANVLHVMDMSGSHESVANLVLLIGASDEENLQIKTELRELSVLDGLCNHDNHNSLTPRGLTVVNTDQVPVYKRNTLYSKGGVFSVTSRILVVDMLAGAIDCSRITGIVVLHAERVIATSNEAFILRIFRQKNKSGFIKAFSDKPERISTGFSPLSATLKQLQLQKVQLWPRFHVQVTEDLAGLQVRKQNTDVIELEIEMSPTMKQMQSAVLESIEACISQIKKTNPQIDTNDWTLDNALKQDFVTMVHLQLDPIWHRISWKTRQLVADLSTLRQIINALPVLDSVGFYQMLETVLLASSRKTGFNDERSPWLAMDAAHTLFTVARQRVFGNFSPSDMKPAAFIEELPKWHHLINLLAEITAEKVHGTVSTGPILIMCNERRTSRQLQQLIRQQGPSQGQAYLKKLFAEYKEWRKGFVNVRSGFSREYAQAKPSDQAPSTSNRQDANNRQRAPNGSSAYRGNPNKRRRVRGGSAAAQTTRTATIVDVEDLIELEDDGYDYVPEPIDGIAQDSDSDQDLIISNVSETRSYDLLDMSDLVIIQHYDNRKDDGLNDQLMPSYIIMYDPDPAFIRRIELHRAYHPQRKVKTYFLYYGESVEEQRFLFDVRREKDAFTKLIREKASMPVTLRTEQDAERPVSTILTNVTSRIAGGGLRALPDEPARVVVDMREFRSSLPSLLHEQNIQVVPVVLTVGDYILTPDICVERKSVADLVSSFKDGRLYTQCEVMFRYYKHPTLLIEFDEAKSFSLEPFSDTPSGAVSSATAKMMQENVQQKLALLLLTFPKLKIIWSSSPFQSAEIFLELKRSQDEPNVDISVQYGQDESHSSERMENYIAIDMLRSIPGITIRNYVLLINKVKNFRALCMMPEEVLAKIIGNEAARKVSQFLLRNVREAEK